MQVLWLKLKEYGEENEEIFFTVYAEII